MLPLVLAGLLSLAIAPRPAAAYQYSFVEEELLETLTQNAARLKLVSKQGEPADAGTLFLPALTAQPANDFGVRARIGGGKLASAPHVSCAKAGEASGARGTNYDCLVRFPKAAKPSLAFSILAAAEPASRGFLVRARRPYDGDQKLRLRSYQITVL